jgi:hypothetical protein
VGPGALVCVRGRLESRECRIMIRLLVKSPLTIGAVLLVAGAVTACAWEEPILITNRTAITNGQKVVEAILSVDTQKSPDVKSLVGSEVAFVAHRGHWDRMKCMLNLQSNVVLVVEFDPPYPPSPDARVSIPWFFWITVEVSGKVKSIDLPKRTVTIIAKLEDVRVREEGW